MSDKWEPSNYNESSNSGFTFLRLRLSAAELPARIRGRFASSLTFPSPPPAELPENDEARAWYMMLGRLF